MDSTRILRLPPTAGPSSYDPHADVVSLAPDASPYQLAHERAHQAQRKHRTRIWRLHGAVPLWLPYLSRFTRLALEWQARNMALRALALCGRLNRAATAEASRSLSTYFLALLLIPTPAETALEEVTSPATAKALSAARRRLVLPPGQDPSNRAKNPNGVAADVSRNRPPRAS